MPKKRQPPGRKRTPPPKTDEEKLLDDQPSETAGFTPRTLDRSIIAIPLLRELVEEDKRGRQSLHDVVIDLHLEFPGGREQARERVIELLGELTPRANGSQPHARSTSQYMFTTLYGEEIRQLVRLDQRRKRPSIFRIWPDFPLRALLVRSVSTVKADAAHSSFAAYGQDIV